MIYRGREANNPRFRLGDRVRRGSTQAATNKISAQNATIVAVAWAGGLSKREKGGPPNSLLNVGGGPAGGFYNASYVRPDSVELRNGPIPYYLVRMTGVIGKHPPDSLCRSARGRPNHTADAN